MKDDKKYVRADGEITRLQRENGELRDRLKEKELELDGAKATIEEMGEAYQKLLDQYDEYLYSYSVQVEELAEAKMVYEAETERLRLLIRQYQKEADGWLSAMKKQNRKVV
jgi:chromosome segregation ATPase